MGHKKKKKIMYKLLLFTAISESGIVTGQRLNEPTLPPLEKSSTETESSSTTTETESSESSTETESSESSSESSESSSESSESSTETESTTESGTNEDTENAKSLGSFFIMSILGIMVF